MQSVMVLCTNTALILDPPQTVKQCIPNHFCLRDWQYWLCVQHLKTKSNIFQLGFSHIISPKIEVTHLKFHKTLWKVPTSSTTFASRKINKDTNCTKKTMRLWLTRETSVEAYVILIERRALHPTFMPVWDTSGVTLLFLGLNVLLLFTPLGYFRGIRVANMKSW